MRADVRGKLLTRVVKPWQCCPELHHPWRCTRPWMGPELPLLLGGRQPTAELHLGGLWGPFLHNHAMIPPLKTRSYKVGPVWSHSNRPAAAFCSVKAWIWGVTVDIFPSEMMEESSLVISKLSFMFGWVIPPLFVLLFVFLFAILGGNFIFNFLLFSCKQKEQKKVTHVKEINSTSHN